MKKCGVGLGVVGLVVATGGHDHFDDGGDDVGLFVIS